MAFALNILTSGIRRSDLEKIKKTVSQVVAGILTREKAGGLVSVSLVGPGRMKELNRKYRQKNDLTDVLSFPLSEPKILGDVIICWPVARKQARRLGHSFWTELGWLVAHGTLHLLGYDHRTKKGLKTMEEKSAQILAALKV